MTAQQGQMNMNEFFEQKLMVITSLMAKTNQSVTVFLESSVIFVMVVEDWSALFLHTCSDKWQFLQKKHFPGQNEPPNLQMTCFVTFNRVSNFSAPTDEGRFLCDQLVEGRRTTAERWATLGKSRLSDVRELHVRAEQQTVTNSYTWHQGCSAAC